MTTAASISAVQLIRLRDELGAPLHQQVAAACALTFDISDRYGAAWREQCARILTERERRRAA